MRTAGVGDLRIPENEAAELGQRFELNQALIGDPRITDATLSRAGPRQ
jgi:hypothetical protein